MENNLKNYTKKELREYIEELQQDITEASGLIDEAKEELDNRTETYSMGQRFSVENGEDYILAQTGFSKVNFISLIDGNRFSTAVHVHDNQRITEEELNELCEVWELIE